jgi:hypothetical protein
LVMFSDPDAMQSLRKTNVNNASTMSSSATFLQKTPTKQSVAFQTTGTGAGTAMDSPKGMNTSMSRNVKGQVVIPTKSPSSRLHSTSSLLHSTSQLSSSMQKIGAQTQNSFTNDATRYMDQTQSRKAAWGPASSGPLAAAMAGASLDPPPRLQPPALQTKTTYGSSAAWLMDFRCVCMCVCMYVCVCVYRCVMSSLCYVM